MAFVMILKSKQDWSSQAMGSSMAVFKINTMSIKKRKTMKMGLSDVQEMAYSMKFRFFMSRQITFTRRKSIIWIELAR